MNKVAIAKKTAKFVVGSSVSFATANVIRNNTTPQTTVQQVEVVVGGVVVGMMVAEQAENWTDRKIDAVVNWYKNLTSDESSTK